MANKTVISISKPTPLWATYIFRTVLILTTAATIIIASDKGIDAELGLRIAAYLKGLDFVVWSLSKMIGIEIEKPKWQQ